MASIFKPTYTKPIPEGAQIITKDGKRFAKFKDRRGRQVQAPLTEDGTKILLESKKWYVKYKDADGKEQKVPGSTDRGATEQKAADLERRAARRATGLVDPYEDHRKRPLAEHLADFRAALKAKGNTPEYVALVLGRLEAIAEGCSWRGLDDMDMSQADGWLDRQRGGAPVILPEVPADYTPREVGAMLGISLTATLK